MISAARRAELMVLFWPMFPAILVMVVCVVLAIKLAIDDRARLKDQVIRAQVPAAVAVVKQEETAALAPVVQEANVQIHAIREGTRRAVARVQVAAAQVPTAADPDPVGRAFYDGVCASRFYLDDPLCHGRGGQP